MIYIFIIYLIYKLISIILSIYLCFTIKSNKLNKDNVCLVFYRPKKDLLKFIKNLFNGCLFSSGLVIGDKLYQMRKENKTLRNPRLSISPITDIPNPCAKDRFA